MYEGLRIGAVSYLNSKPLVAALAELAPKAEIVVDVPSRLAQALASGELDVALVPSIEYFRGAGYTIVSDACVACVGPVKSVKLFSRVAPEAIRTLALDEGSRTSVALGRILLKERVGVEPRLERLPLDCSLLEAQADAVLLIGDRAMVAPTEEFTFVWDLGKCWVDWTGLPFVFSMWLARPGLPARRLERLFASARDLGVERLGQIAQEEASGVGISTAESLSYLRDHLVFYLGSRERLGLERFGHLVWQHGLISSGESIDYEHRLHS